MKILIVSKEGSSDDVPGLSLTVGCDSAGPDEYRLLTVREAQPNKTNDWPVMTYANSSASELSVLAIPPSFPLGVLRKMLVEYAILENFDILVMWDAPCLEKKRIDELMQPLRQGAAVTVARFESSFRGWLGSIASSATAYMARKLLGLEVADPWQSVRAYLMRTLSNIPFESCRDDKHFDFEMLHLLQRRGMVVAEVKISDSQCSVRGSTAGFVARLMRVVAASVASKIHDTGLRYQRKYDKWAGETQYDIKLGYLSSHSLAMDLVKPEARVLDLACGPGDFARALSKKGCRVTGVDRRAAVPVGFERFVLADLDDPEPFGHLGRFDWILALDCLEHLDNPEQLLSFLRRDYGADKVRLLVTTPNVAFLPVRLALLVGRFNYGRMGILDFTHKRLFTFPSLRRILEDSGCMIESIQGIPAPYPKALGPGLLAKCLLMVNLLLIKIAPSLFSYQIAAVARFRPPLSGARGKGNASSKSESETGTRRK